MAIDKKILSIDADDDDVDVKTFSKFIHDHTERDKNKTANEFTELGEDLLNEIAEKNKRKDRLKIKQSKYIHKHSIDYTWNQLESYSYKDVQDIYNEIHNRRNTFNKIFRFIFNL
jgi:putative lipase involved disintegration of autophagic bodies